MSGAAFYCVSSELYFPGAVALINSLRRAGHTEPIHLLDCGLEPAHRELLAGEVDVVEAAGEIPPYLLKTVAPLARPAETMVLVDVDMIVTRSLAPLIERASQGDVVAVKDNRDRFVAEWGELLDLGPLERRPYVSSGLVVLGGERGAEVLRLWADRLPRADYERSWFAADAPGYPFRFIDQDVLNAVLCARVPPERLEVIEPRLAPTPPFDGLPGGGRGQDLAYADGARPYVLHHFHRKPWVARLHSNPYSRLLTELLLDGDGPLRLDPSELPLRLRRGPGGAIDRAATDLARIPAGIARRLRALPGR
jgi:hypothetical protein